MLLSKNVVGFSTGEILLVTGTIHNDANGLYVNANTMQRLLPATKKTRTQAIARSELLRLPAPINMTILTGVYIAEEEQGYLNRKRSAYLRGDLKSKIVFNRDHTGTNGVRERIYLYGTDCKE